MQTQKAFTLIELLVAMVIVGILAAFAYPGYQDYVRKSRRTDAQGALMSFTIAMENRFADTDSYCDAAGAGGANVCGTATNDTGTPAIHPGQSPVDGGVVYYNLTINAVTDTTFTLHATPTGSQANDDCGTLTLTNTGLKGITAAAAGVSTGDCW